MSDTYDKYATDMTNLNDSNTIRNAFQAKLKNVSETGEWRTA